MAIFLNIINNISMLFPDIKNAIKNSINDYFSLPKNINEEHIVVVSNELLSTMYRSVLIKSVLSMLVITFVSIVIGGSIENMYMFYKKRNLKKNKGSQHDYFIENDIILETVYESDNSDDSDDMYDNSQVIDDETSDSDEDILDIDED
jgi:hypothetical protein